MIQCLRSNYIRVSEFACEHEHGHEQEQQQEQQEEQQQEQQQEQQEEQQKHHGQGAAGAIGAAGAPRTAGATCRVQQATGYNTVYHSVGLQHSVLYCTAIRPHFIFLILTLWSK